MLLTAASIAIISFFLITFAGDFGKVFVSIFAITALSITAVQSVVLSRQLKKNQKKTKEALQFSESAYAAAWIDRKIKPLIPLPPLSRWALSPDTAGYLINLIEQKKPRVMLELGSGVSTIMAGYVMKEIGIGKIVSLDAEKEFLQKTKILTEIHGLQKEIELIHAPLEYLNLSDWEGYWYKLDVFTKFTEQQVDLLLIDGPPTTTGPLARYPALPMLEKYLSSDAIILFDDAERSEEKEILRDWENFGWHVQLLPFRAGAAMLVKRD